MTRPVDSVFYAVLLAAVPSAFGQQSEPDGVTEEVVVIDQSCTRLRVHIELVEEAGAEWNIPDDWTPCFVRVDAAGNTSFSFFEFA